jgi:DNA-binding transcriptional MocR family regulator
MTELQHAADEEHGHRPGLRSSRRPRYLKIAELLRAEIHNGTHAVGRRMPTEDVLCRRFSVSRFTVREALRQLEEHGLIARRRGTSGIVLSTEPRVHYDQQIRSIDELLQYKQAGDFSCCTAIACLPTRPSPAGSTRASVSSTCNCMACAFNAAPGSRSV